MYKLKEGVTWNLIENDIKTARMYTGTIDRFDRYFEEIELPKVEYKKCEIKISEKKELIIDEFGIKIFDFDTGIFHSVLIGGKIIETIQDFNNKCSQKLGFELIESEG